MHDFTIIFILSIVIAIIAALAYNYVSKNMIIDLDKSENKYRNLIENINDVIYEIDNTGIITYISPNIEKLLEYKHEEIIGKEYNQFVGGNADFLAQRLL
ncbi:MAG: PAS domain-containing protein [Bacteroidota bacterium]